MVRDIRYKNVVKRSIYTIVCCLVTIVLALGSLYVWEVRRSNRELERPFNEEGSVALRKFPYPYRAGLAISSDIDNTESLEELVEIMEFLNTRRSTRIGEGVGLEVGNSFFFWEPPGEAISYFMCDDRTKATIRKFIESGHIDVMHSYGKKHDFVRQDAIQALEELEKYNCRVDVWVDHTRTIDNLGDDVGLGEGDHPESKAYHADLTLGYGIKFAWMGRVTMIAGQVAPVRIGNYLEIFDARHPLESCQNMGKELAKNVLGVFGNRQYSIHKGNDLVKITELDDGQKVYEFVRFDYSLKGVTESADIIGLATAISEETLNRLKEVEGYMIVYSHLGTKRSHGFIPEETEVALRHLADECRTGNVYVTTTSKLLNYCVASKFLNWSYRQIGDETIVDIKEIRDPISGNRVPAIEELQGITFYVPKREKARIHIDGREVTKIQRNERDDSGKESVSIPLRYHRYPLS